MLKRVNEILIGKDIDRGSIGGTSDYNDIMTNINEGEVIVLTQNMIGFDTSTDDFSTTPIIYIVEGTSETREYVDPVSGANNIIHRLIVSAPIDGNFVRNYVKESYVAKVEQSVSFPAITDTIVAGTEYVLRIVYKDIVERPAPYTETYRYVAKEGDTSTNIFDGLRKRINANKGRLSIKGGARVTANALGSATLDLVGKPIPECTTTVKDIDEFSQVQFEAFLNYVDNDYQWTEVGLSSDKTYVQASSGYGIWEIIRDIEKHAQSYRGVDNRIWFPIQLPEMRTQKFGGYNTIVIEHDRKYKSADNQYNKETELTTMIAFETLLGSPTTHQGSLVEADLDKWMASLPVPKSSTALTW